MEAETHLFDTEEVSLLLPGGGNISVRQYAEDVTIDGKTEVPGYDDSMIEWFAEAAKQQVQYGFDCIFIITGERRTGKSTLAQMIARNIDTAFPPQNICFEVADFNKRLAELPNANPAKGIYPQLILDEAGWDLFAQNWMQQLQKNFVRKFEVIGAKRVIVYFIVPHRKFLNTGLREGMGRFWLYTTTKHMQRGYAECHSAKPNKWEITSFWEPLCVMLFPPPLEDDFKREYEAAKDAFIEKVLRHEEDNTRLLSDPLFRAIVDDLKGRSGETYRQVQMRLGIPKTTFYQRIGTRIEAEERKKQ